MRTLLLHLNSARSGDTQWRQSYSSPAKRGRGEGGGECGCAHGLLWLMWCDSDRALPLIHQNLDITLLQHATNSPNYRVSSQRNGAGCRHRALGGSTLSVTGCCVSGLDFLHMERPSLLFACNIMRAAGRSVTAVIKKILQSFGNENKTNNRFNV